MKDGYERELDVGRTGCLRCSSALARLPFGRACGCSGGKHVEDLLTNPQLVRVIFHSKKALSMESICICVNPPLPTWNHRLHDRVKQLVLQSNSLESISIPSVPDEIHQNPRLRPTGQDSQQPPPSQSSKPKLHPPRTEGQSEAEGRRTSHPWPLDGTSHTTPSTPRDSGRSERSEPTALARRPKTGSIRPLHGDLLPVDELVKGQRPAFRHHHLGRWNPAAGNAGDGPRLAEDVGKTERQSPAKSSTAGSRYDSSEGFDAWSLGWPAEAWPNGSESPSQRPSALAIAWKGTVARWFPDYSWVIFPSSFA